MDRSASRKHAEEVVKGILFEHPAFEQSCGFCFTCLTAHVQQTGKTAAPVKSNDNKGLIEQVSTNEVPLKTAT